MASHGSSEDKNADQSFRSKSCETACSSNSSCFFRRRQPPNPLAGSFRSILTRTTGNSNNAVRQRVLSAKLLKLKTVQNQLNDANYHLAELTRENQALRTLQKRQDKALLKYEGTNADLPRLLQVHEEDIRILTEKNRILRKTVREFSEQFKNKNEEVNGLQEQLKHFERLDKDKRLLERGKLVEQVEDLKLKLQKADETIVILNRKLNLEEKSAKQRLNQEIIRHKQCQKELTLALNEIGKMTKLLESKNKFAQMVQSDKKQQRFSNMNPRQTMSLVSLTSTRPNGVLPDKVPVTNVKLEPIRNEISTKKEGNTQLNGTNRILRPPSENVKARLSSTSQNSNDSSILGGVQHNLEDQISVDSFESVDERKDEPKESKHDLDDELWHDDQERINLVQQEAVNGDTELKRQDSFHKSNQLEEIIQRREVTEVDRRLGDYCLKALDSVKDCNNAIESHKEKLEQAKSETRKLLEGFKEVEDLDLKLRDSKIVTFETKDLTDENMHLVTQILNDELSFQKQYPTRNGSVGKREPSVAFKEKKKLLATLRAIDNGESVDSFEGPNENNRALMKELFGDAAN